MYDGGTGFTPKSQRIRLLVVLMDKKAASYITQRPIAVTATCCNNTKKLVSWLSLAVWLQFGTLLPKCFFPADLGLFSSGNIFVADP